MFMRTVKMFVRLDALEEFRREYENKILAVFDGVKGCRFATLLQSSHTPEECVSLTFWRTEEDARDYEQSGEYERLINMLSPYFSESSELQIRLTKDLRLEYTSSQEPVVRKFEVDHSQEAQVTGRTFLRMVSLKFKENKVTAFKKHYENDVIPILCAVKGCRRAFLAAPADNPNELISVTEWESEHAARAYETGGQFRAILESQRHFFSGLADWGEQWEKEMGGRAATSDDVTVDFHRVLISRSFAQ